MEAVLAVSGVAMAEDAPPPLVNHVTGADIASQPASHTADERTGDDVALPAVGAAVLDAVASTASMAVPPPRDAVP